MPVILFLTYGKIVAGQWILNGYMLSDRWDRLGFGDNTGPPGSNLAHFSPQVSLSNIANEMERFHLSLFGWPFFFAVALVFVPFVTARATRFDWTLLAAAASVIFAYSFYWGTSVAEWSFPRYWYLVVPCFAILAARGFQTLYRIPLLGSSRMSSRTAALIAPACLLALLTWFNLGVYMPKLQQNVAARNVNNGAPAAAVYRAGIHHAIVFQVWTRGGGSNFGCIFNQNSPVIGRGDIIWAHDEGALDARLMREFPGRSYYRLTNTTVSRLTSATVVDPPMPQGPLRGVECSAAFAEPDLLVRHGVSSLAAWPPRTM